MNPLYFTLMGLLGALSYTLIWSRDINDLKKYESIRHLVIGAVVGYIYWILHREHGYPDTVMAYVAGWMGADFISAVIDKYTNTILSKKLKQALSKSLGGE